MQNIDGSGNLTETPDANGNTGISIANAIINDANQDLLSNPVLSGSFGPGDNPSPIQYQYELYQNSPTDPGVYFHQVSPSDYIYFNSSPFVTPGTSSLWKNEYSVNGNKVIDVYLCGAASGATGYGGVAENIGSGSQVKFYNFWNNYNNSSVGWWAYIGTMKHEIAHLLGLVHSWGYIEQGTNTLVNCNGSCGVFSQSNTSCGSQWAVDNNVMSYNPSCTDHQNCQLGTIHQYLSTLPTFVDVDNYMCTYDATKTVNIYNGENVLWNSTRYLQGDIVVQSGATLTISCKLGMAPGAVITVQPGGTLNVDGGWITNICGNLWGGIYVQGDNTQDQQMHNGAYYQGVCNITNGATIEYAHDIGLWDGSNVSTSGGILKASNSTFLNNRRSAEFINYHSGIANVSYFTNCTFTVDDNYPAINDPFAAHISMWSVDNVSINNCTFQNLTSPDPNIPNQDVTMGEGIVTIDASINFGNICNCLRCTFPCPDADQVGSTFSNLYKAIDVTDAASTATFSISHSTFNNCFYGIYASSINNFKVYENTFNIGGNQALGQTYQQEGLRINSCIGFQVEANTFKASPSLYGNPLGTVCVNLGTTANQIYRNTFSGLEVANLANNNNFDHTGANMTGLQYLCNNQSGSTGYDIAATGTNLPTDGIKFKQGSPSLAAANTFSHNGSQYGDLDGETTNGFDYFYTHGSASSPTIPDYYSPNVNPIPIQFEGVCPSTIPQPGKINIQPWVVQHIIHKAAFLNYQAAYLLLIDGGNTAAMQSDILAALPPQSWELYNSLMKSSPYLSIGAIEKAISVGTDILPNAMLYDIVSANSDLLKQGEIYDLLAAKPDPMPDYFVALLQAQQGIQTPRGVLEASMADERTAMNYAADMVVASYLGDSIVNIDSVAQWHSNKQDLEDDDAVAAMLLQQGNPTASAALMQSLPAAYGLKGDRLYAQNQLIAVNQILGKCVSGAKSLLNKLEQEDISALTKIATDGRDMATAQAQAILNFFYQGSYNIPPIMPGQKGFKSLSEKKPTATVSGLTIFPNPAINYAEVIWQLPQIGDKATLIISTIEGTVINTYPVSNKSGQMALDTKALAPGLYIVSISWQGGTPVAQKLTVSK